MLCLADL
jgi:hypothetical protein